MTRNLCLLAAFAFVALALGIFFNIGLLAAIMIAAVICNGLWVLVWYYRPRRF